MLLGMLMASSLDASVKAIVSDISLPQIVFLRSVFSLPVILLVCRIEGGGLRGLRTTRPGWHLYRGLLASGASFGFFWGLGHVEFLTAVLLAHIAPVVVVLLSKPVLGEQVRLVQWVGITIGFIGVLVVVDPGGLDFHPAVLAIIGSSVCWALLSLSNRKLVGVEPAGALLFYMVPIAAVIGLVLAIPDWTTPSARELYFLMYAGVATGLLHLFVLIAYRHARAATVAPLEYSTLIWSALAGYFFWAELPTILVVGGGVLILTGGAISIRGGVSPEPAAAS